jgi:glutamate/tyrosine decarboxylase-like PLP-dependent enzyme
LDFRNLVKDIGEFQRLMSRPGSDYLQERTTYNPGNYVQEVSRSGSYATAGWATLKYFGHEVSLGGILEVQHELRKRIQQEADMICVNPNDNGFVTLLRIYPKDISDRRLSPHLYPFKYRVQTHRIQP